MSCEEDKVMKWLVALSPSIPQLPTKFLLCISVQVLEQWKFSCKFFKKPLFQWLISSLFPEKNLQYILAAKQALKEWSSLSTSIIKVGCLSFSPVKVQPSLSDAYATEEYKSPHSKIHTAVVTIKVLSFFLLFTFPQNVASQLNLSYKVEGLWNVIINLTKFPDEVVNSQKSRCHGKIKK